MPLSEIQVIDKSISAFQQHPDTKGSPLGNLRNVLSRIYTSDGDFRKKVDELNGNALADYVCGAAERLTKGDRKPWRRAGPQATGKVAKAAPKKNGEPSSKGGGQGTKGGGRAPVDLCLHFR